MKKLFIAVKRGLVRDPKHRMQMGECIWLFEYMIDICDWETGVIPDWLDVSAAEEMAMPLRTLRQQRRKLEANDYITCVQKKRGQRIAIKNWSNPRDYSGEVQNPKAAPREGGNEKEPLKKKERKGYIKGDNKGYIKGSSQNVTPTSDSYIIKPNNHINKSVAGRVSHARNRRQNSSQ